MERTVESVIVSGEELSRVAAILRRALVAPEGGAAVAQLEQALVAARTLDECIEKVLFALLARAPVRSDGAVAKEVCDQARRGGCSGPLVVKHCRASCGYAARRCVAHGGNVARGMEGTHFARKHTSAKRPARRETSRKAVAKSTPSPEDALRETRVMVEAEARKLAARSVRGRDVVDDLINEGAAAVLASLARYDVSRGPLANFCRRRVHGAMCDWLTGNGTAITVRGRLRANVTSLDAPVAGTDDLRLVDTLTDGGASPEEALLAKEGLRLRRARNPTFE